MVVGFDTLKFVEQIEDDVWLPLSNGATQVSEPIGYADDLHLVSQCL